MCIVSSSRSFYVCLTNIHKMKKKKTKIYRTNMIYKTFIITCNLYTICVVYSIIKSDIKTWQSFILVGNKRICAQTRKKDNSFEYVDRNIRWLYDRRIDSKSTHFEWNAHFQIHTNILGIVETVVCRTNWF